MSRRWLLLALLAPLWGCRSFSGSDLASADDYQGAQFFDRAGDYDSALALFPTKEEGGFVTGTERGWLELLAKHPDPRPLLALGRDLEDRKTVHVSREAKAFFYKETEEGYFPAEHEAILLHLIAGMSLAAAGRTADAQVEARRASLYLEDTFSGGRPFDDPALRLWSAGLWASVGDWESARVDLRRAAELDPRMQWASALAAARTPPPGLALVFDGGGPDVAWTGSGHEVRFVFPDGDPDVRVRSAAGRPLAAPPVATAAWYARHQERNQTLKEVFSESRYMLEATTSTTASAVTLAAGFTIGMATGAVGIAGGAAFIYYLLPGSAGDTALGIVLGGVAIAATGVKAGLDAHAAGKDRAKEMVDEGVGQAGYYRYVRFLPDRVRLVALDSPEAPKVTVDGRPLRPFFAPAAAPGAPRVYAFAGARPQKAVPKPEAVLEVRHFPLFGDLVFAFSSTARTGDEATVACGGLPRDLEAGDWRLPGQADLRQAVAAHIKQDGPENLLAKRLTAMPPPGLVWVRKDGDACRVAPLDSSAKPIDVPCTETHPLLCVAGR